MKRLICIAAALMMVSVFAASSFAANEVQMTLTSPTIYKAGCEKIGSTTYTFDSGSVISNGDWWYMDLPEGITLCKNYNYVIAQASIAAPSVYFNAAAANPYENAAFFNNAAMDAIVSPLATGPLSLTGTAPAASTIVGNGMAFLVKGTSGSRRITIYVLSTIGPNGTTGQATTFTAAANTNIQFKLFDGKAWSLTDGTLADALGHNRILTDYDGDGLYGEIGANAKSGNEVIGKVNTADSTGGVPYVDNTLCSNNTSLSGQYIYTSYASKNDVFTFSGDSQIAHTAATGSISLEQCHKNGTLKGDLALSSSQTVTTCKFGYETAGDFCDTAFKNRFIIKASSAFGDIGDKYTLNAEITSPSDGVYFSGAPSVYLYSSSSDACTATLPAAQTITWLRYEGSTAITNWAPTTCTINTGYRVSKVVQDGTVTTLDLDSKNQIFVDFADFAYGNTMVAAGEEVTVKVSLDRYPCGTIFSASRTIGSFVTSCTTSSSSTIYFPWLPGNGAASSGWWGGYVITNIGTTSGTAKLTYYDSNGKSATYTTPAVAAGAQFNGTAVTSANLTNVDGYDASLNFSIKAVCAFSARGFAFTGNTREGVGYTSRP